MEPVQSSETISGRYIKLQLQTSVNFYQITQHHDTEDITCHKDGNGGHITDPVGKANNLNKYYASVFTSKRDIPDTNSINSEKSFHHQNYHY
jgi:hypothetical protein